MTDEGVETLLTLLTPVVGLVVGVAVLGVVLVVAKYVVSTVLTYAAIAEKRRRNSEDGSDDS